MQVLFDFLPLVAFFIAYKYAGIYVATAVITLSVLLLVAYRLLRREQLTTLQKLSAGLMLGLGGLTLILHDDRFILWKPTVYYWLVSGGLLIGQLVSKQNVLEKLIGEGIKLSRERWMRLTWVWVVMFALLGVLNLYVAFNYSRDTWITFKFVLVGIFFVFIFIQGLWIVMRAEDIEDPSVQSGVQSPDKPSA